MRVNPYLLFNGNCEEAFGAYAKILGGKIVGMMPFEGSPAGEKTPADWRKKILHARLEFGDNVLMASDAPPDRFQKMQGISVTLNVADPAEADRIFNGLADRATVTMPLSETFWALKFGMLTDRFGTPWMINCAKPS
jgi:PhnB protein